ncbi:hypothetical protein KS4_34240 [Poriferisphaera corsica]|uniref:Uncharacterized protein n=1 Tax=Poriferisphaera corsica TaxID=2528020 RepID=A0A517YYP2_9BACT|nr:hypothetical protein [Poriferisphaera corsica]QDU35343.1 hypothetical protein KS4_34240 [Poriferisphaera corsica]
MTTTSGPKLCPNCNRYTKFNTQNATRFCPHCAWGTDAPIRKNQVLTEASDPPLPKQILIINFILTPIILFAPYALLIYFNIIKQPVHHLIYWAAAIVLIILGFFIGPEESNLDDGDFSYSTNSIFAGEKLEAAFYLYILLLPGRIIATTIKSTYHYLFKN